jgi:flagellar biosynthesis GTPase FlhF
MVVAQHLHDRLAWDKEPPHMDDWWRLVQEKPIEALWMAALSETRTVRKEFGHIAEHALENYRSSPECTPPSWEFVEALLAVQAQTNQDLREAEKQSEDAERRNESEKERLDELREELKRLRRENSELRAERAVAERRTAETLAQLKSRMATSDERRIEELERRLRKAEKEREHLARERARGAESAPTAEAPLERPSDEAPAPAPSRLPPPSEDPNGRRRVLRQILKKLFKKGKIGASHTHEDNVFRGVPDHDKGVAKEAMDLLYREGLLLPKPTVTDPHVSLRPDRTAEVQAIIAGQIENPRLRRFVSE